MGAGRGGWPRAVYLNVAAGDMVAGAMLVCGVRRVKSYLPSRRGYVSGEYQPTVNEESPSVKEGRLPILARCSRYRACSQTSGNATDADNKPAARKSSQKAAGIACRACATFCRTSSTLR